MKYIVSKQSGAHIGSCILGTGDTKEEALVDAFGPRPWSDWNKKSERTSCCREVTDEEFEEIVYS